MPIKGLVLTLAALITLPASAKSAAAKEEIRVAAASDLKFALEELSATFEKKFPAYQIEEVYGATGNFYQQISQGAPYDLFLAADADYPKRLYEAGGHPSQPFPYAKGKVVLWARTESPVKLDKSKGLDNLKNASKIAIANPDHAPYGKAAKAALEKAEVYTLLSSKIVVADSVSHAAQFAKTGAADVGMIALGLAMSPEMQKSGSYLALSDEISPPLAQAGLVLKSRKKGAEVFRDFIISAEGQAVLARFGFQGDTSRSH